MSQSAAAQIIEAMDSQADAFRADVTAGLSQDPKKLPSRWLYDDRGSELFEKITTLPEYYPTRTETAILRAEAQSLAQFCGRQAVIIEYGAGASVKSQILLDALAQPRLYMPVDIAGDFLAVAATRLRKRYPSLDIHPVAADFTTDFDLPDNTPEDAARVGFFPGSTIGNLDPHDAVAFLARVHRHVDSKESGFERPGRALIGIDLQKPTEILIPAYDDAAGVTADFNLNILRRINRELGGNFDLDAYRHEARWNDKEAAIEMHIVADCEQQVTINGQKYSFADGETIHTESSRKYTLERFSDIAAKAGWRATQHWTDEDHLFAIVGLEAV